MAKGGNSGYCVCACACARVRTRAQGGYGTGIVAKVRDMRELFEVIELF